MQSLSFGIPCILNLSKGSRKQQRAFQKSFNSCFLCVFIVTTAVAKSFLKYSSPPWSKGWLVLGIVIAAHCFTSAKLSQHKVILKPFLFLSLETTAGYNSPHLAVQVWCHSCRCGFSTVQGDGNVGLGIALAAY